MIKINFRRREFKSQARESLRGGWNVAVAASILTALIFVIRVFQVLSDIISHLDLSGNFELGDDVVSFNMFLGTVDLIIRGSITLGASLLFLNLVRRDETSLSQLFYYFTSGFRFVQGLAYNFFTSLYIYLWTLLLFIPGIIKTYAYSMTCYIINDNPGIGVNEAITKSRLMTRGYRWQLFVLDLSFTGWWILCVLTLGLAYFYFYPYYIATYARVYQELKNQPHLEEPKE